MTTGINTIAENVEKVLQFNSRFDINEDSVPTLIESWYTNKKHLLNNLFNGEMIVKTDEEVTIEKDLTELESIFKTFLSDVYIYSTYVGDLKEFLSEQGMEAFFKNQVLKDYKLDEREIRKGMKISRSMKYFIKDKNILEKIQNRYSMILQDLTIKGKLVLSIHPLDYLSISETNYKWHSCHSLDGEYASGNLNYMTDSCTIVAYLASDEETVLRNFSTVNWNSKKWRMLFYLDKDYNLIVGSKNYPFKSEALTEKSFNALKDLIKDKQWEEREIIYNKAEAKSIISDAKDTVHFNDCLLSSTYRGWYCKSTEYTNETIEIGAPFRCLQCDDEVVTIGGSDFRCSSCSGIVECSCCGCAVDETEIVYCNDIPYCEDCAWDVLCYCEGCNQYFEPDGGEIEWFENLEAYYCNDCAESLEPDELEDECYE